MEEILACRVCLATDVKLFDVYSNKLVSAFEMVTGIQITMTDGLPHKMCNYCSITILKNAAFKERCLNTQEMLRYLTETEMISTDYLRDMDRTNVPSFPPYVIESVYSMESKDEIKEEDIDYRDVEVTIDNDIKSEASDEEPLSKKVKKNCEPEIKAEIGVAPEIDLMFLSKQQQMDELKAKMRSLNYRNSLYKCELCYKGFMTDVTYKNHMIRHDSNVGTHRCEICSIYCSSERTLRSHVATSHERKYICKLCNYVTKSGSRAREHSRWHSGHTYVCQLCGTSFAKSTSYFTHVRLRHPTNHSCSLCGESFIGENGLNMHIKKAHTLQDSRVLNYQCKYCNVKFYNEDALRKHGDIKDCDINKSPCLQCGESYTSEEKLNDHFKMVHEATKCQQCDKTFSNERSYAIHHQRVHLGLRLKRHGKRSPSARTVVCEHCGKACHSKAKLIHHQRTHTGERPFHCNNCPKKFTNLQLLQVHTGEKPYVCPHCDKAFSQSNSMKLHVNTVHLKMPAPYRARRKEFAVC
ncbi:zinc finger protein 70-like isoform X2 [Plodia interpunctella]|uniref:zinc finger protein 70-like isoform X2 n=1 Tax=Plodia interpunctella TaxID=58824 RepID=UPI002368A6C1|nr:zinc finger protein 70-like isoform X2 [Plodia interpunctella]